MDYALVLNAPSLERDIEESLIIAADGGYRLVTDRAVQAIIGDFDTLGYIPDTVLTISHPVDKDKTDGELALDYIKNLGAESVSIYGASGGHSDHVLGNLNLLAYADYIGLSAVIKNNDEDIYFVSNRFELEIFRSSVVSILPFGGRVTFKKSKGLYYCLDGITIEPYSSLGISNKATDSKISIEILEGKAIIVVRKK